MNKTKLNSIYNQHWRYLAEERRQETPIEAFVADLDTAIQEWLDEGKDLIICIDANQDIRNGSIQEMFQ